MVKYSCCLLVIFLSIAYVAEAQKFPEILEKCKAAENATDNDYLNLKNNVKPKTKAMKCMGTCIAEKLGWINNKKINPDGTMAYAKSLPNTDEKMQQSVKEILEDCKGIQDADRCEFGSKLIDCFREGATKRGIKSLYPQ